MRKKRSVFKSVLTVGLVLSYCFIQAQEIEEYFVDKQWAFFNSTVNNHLSEDVASALKTGIDMDYVDSRLSTKSYVFHNFNGFLIETYSQINFEKEVNEPLYNLKFESGEDANLAEVILYLGEKYGINYTSPEITTPILAYLLDSVLELHDLKNSKRISLQEYWYYDLRANKMVSYLRGAGVYSNTESSNKPVLWIDLRYFEHSVFDRIRIVKNNDSVQSFSSFLKERPFKMEEVKQGYCRFYDQSKYDGFNNEIDIYFEYYSFFNDFDLYFSEFKLKKNKPAKHKLFSGLLVDKKPVGKWIYKYDNGKKRADFTFDENGLNGPYHLYDNLGNLKESGDLIDGKKNGPITAYYTDGKQRSIKNYAAGTPIKTHTLYYSNGNTHSEYSFRNGLVDGVFTEFNTDNSIRMKGRFIRG